MTTTATTTTVTAPSQRSRAAMGASVTSCTLAKRNLIALFRTPTLVVFAIIQPIMFVLLFRYVFGGAIPIPGVAYVNYLVPGILVQTVIFGSVNTAIGLAEDLQKGLIERFKALPMARMAVLGGRTIADLSRSVVVLARHHGRRHARRLSARRWIRPLPRGLSRHAWSSRTASRGGSRSSALPRPAPRRRRP